MSVSAFVVDPGWVSSHYAGRSYCFNYPPPRYIRASLRSQTASSPRQTLPSAPLTKDLPVPPRPAGAPAGHGLRDLPRATKAPSPTASITSPKRRLPALAPAGSQGHQPADAGRLPRHSGLSEPRPGRRKPPALSNNGSAAGAPGSPAPPSPGYRASISRWASGGCGHGAGPAAGGGGGTDTRPPPGTLGSPRAPAAPLRGRGRRETWRSGAGGCAPRNFIPRNFPPSSPSLPSRRGGAAAAPRPRCHLGGGGAGAGAARLHRR